MNHRNGNLALTRRTDATLRRRPDPAAIRVAPVADVFETANAFVLKLDMPGANKGSIDLTIEPGLLTVRSEMTVDKETPAALLLAELVHKTYFRQFNLTKGIATDAATAQFEDGVLTVTLPKTDAWKSQHIPIH